ncbi:lipase/esterase domain protein [Mycobacterium kansasii 732]|nr:lipase/esterase domain protein [Mycobacterium kansasii 732]
MRWTRRIQSTVTGAGVKVIPWIPAPAKRLLTRGRSVVIDGNTLDPTLQLMLSGMRAVGLDGLVIDDDPAASRATMRESLLGFGGPQIHVEVEELTLPGPAGISGHGTIARPAESPHRCWSSITAAAG